MPTTMTPGSILDPTTAEVWQRQLAEWGFLHPKRSHYNLRELRGVVDCVDARRLAELADQTADPDLALNGVERLLQRLTPQQRTRLNSVEALTRLLNLAGSSEQLIESTAYFLEECIEPEFPLLAEQGPLPFEGSNATDLYRWHRRAMTRIVLSDLEGNHLVEETSRMLSLLADRTAQGALELAGGGDIGLAVIAMGKWGGRELNYSSDIDFFLLRRDRSDGPLCERVARRFVQILSGSASQHLYRTDLRLRPGGPSASLVPTRTQALKELARGGAWERMIHIRVHPAAGDLDLAWKHLEHLDRFVYETPFHAQEILKVKGYKDMLEQSIDSDLEHRELKVGWGGIRDVEYVVQFLQLFHGAIYKSIRGGNVFHAIRGLARVGALTTTEKAFLLEGYRFLRRVEHHLMVRHRQQSFRLPEHADARRALARSMRFEQWDVFRAEFDRRRDGVRSIFHRLFDMLFTKGVEGTVDEVNLVLAFKPDKEEIQRVFAPLHFRDPEKAYSLLRRLAYPRNRALQAPRTRHFLAHLFPRLLESLRASADPDQAVLMFTNCVETLGAPAIFYQLLTEHPENCQLFVDLFGSSRFLSDLLLDHPGILDEVIDRLRTGERMEEDRLTQSLEDSLQHAELSAFPRLLHEFRAIHMLEIGILDLSGRLPLSGVLRQLSALARSLLRVIDQHCIRVTEERLGPLLPDADERPPRHAVIALGRLGGYEMGYASDIDLILIIDGKGRTADGIGEVEFYTQHLQTLISHLTNPGTGGPLYSVDLRLRPYGQGGTLVHSFRNFRDYVTSEQSQVWEHQALVRSSPVAGNPQLGEEIVSFVRQNLGRGLTPKFILDDMKAMHARRKEEAQRTLGGFSVKMGPGGILDIEFLAQSAILQNHSSAKDLWEPNTHKALQLLEKHDIVTGAEHASLSTAYSFLRLIENRLSMLHRASARVVPTDDSSLRDLALRIGYDPGTQAEHVMLDEIRYHTAKVRDIFLDHTSEPSPDSA